MSAAPWHKRYHDDALNGYMGLTLEERGAYTTLLDLMYQRGEALLDNERMLSGWMQCSVRKYRAIRDRLIDLGKIARTNEGNLTNERFERECEKSREVSRANSESGRIGGKKSGETRKKNNQNNDDAKQPLQKNEAISEAQSLEDSSYNSESSTNVVPADAGLRSSEYAFKGSTIKLNHEDFERWRQDFPHLSLSAELWALDDWAGNQSNWFVAVSSALAKKERNITDRIHMARLNRERPALRVSGDGRI